MKNNALRLSIIAILPIAFLIGWYVLSVPIKNLYAQRNEPQPTMKVELDKDSKALSIEEKAQEILREATLSNKKFLEESEKNSFDEAVAEANDKVNMLSAEINGINREATLETIKMHKESAVNPLDTGFIKGRSFLIAQKKSEKTIEIYQEQHQILKTLLSHPYASKSPWFTALKDKIAMLQEKEDLGSLESATLNAENRKSIARDSASVRERHSEATYQLQKTQIEAQAARHRMASEELESRYKSALR